MTTRREWHGHGGEVLDTVGDFEVLVCDACGSRHVVPIHFVGDEKLGMWCLHDARRSSSTLSRGGRNDLKRRLYRSQAEIDLGRETVVYAGQPETTTVRSSSRSERPERRTEVAG